MPDHLSSSRPPVRRSERGLLLGGLAVLLATTSMPALAQSGDDADEAQVLDPITVTAVRGDRGRPISSIPGSVTVIEREEIERQATVSRDLGEILSNLVPGFAPSSESLSNFGQPLRGRDVLVTIDGVPQSTPLRNVYRDLRTIDPSAIERIEVIRGSVATYGYGATGGIINIITRTPGDGGPRFTTDVGTSFSLTHPGDSLGGLIAQSASGRSGKVDYAFSASAETVGGFFDAEGDRIPPDPQSQGGLSDSRTYDLLGKVGYALTDDQRVQVTANYYDTEQDTDFTTVPGEVGVRKATTVRQEPPGENQGTENLVLSLDYTHEDVLGSTLSSQIYYQDYFTRFGFSTFFPNGGGQSYLTSEKIGARLALETPVETFGDTVLIWGADYLADTTVQPLEDGRSYVPEIDQQSYAPFAQLEVPVGEDLLLRGGVRYEHINLDVDTFTTLTGGNQVEGGSLSYGETLFNAGAVYFLNDNIDLFASFSQGFSVADIGRTLAFTSAGSVEQFDPEAQIVDNYEIGVRGSWDKLSGEIALFYNTSDLGTTFGNAPDFTIQRQKEEVYGIEASLDYEIDEEWAIGGTFAIYEGKTDTDNDGDLDRYLPGDRIAPPKLTGYVEYEPTETWRNRLQVTYVAGRDRFPGSANFGEGEVEGFATVDLVSEFDAGPGTLRLGIENLLNEQYITPVGQAFNLDTDYAAGQGMRATVRYSISY